MEEPKNGITLGGLVLQSEELKSIASESGCIGLAFGLSKPGKTKNVDLEVYKVSKKGMDYLGEKRLVKDKKGAGQLEGPPKEISKFDFEFGAKLVQCGFDFAYLSLEELELVLQGGAEEVFIAGGIRNYGSMGSIKGDWFTLTISPRSIINKETPNPPKPLGAQPETRLLDSCPPKWTMKNAIKGNVKAMETPRSYSATGDGKTIHFREAE